MKYKIALLIIIMYSKCYSQNQRFIYEYKFVTDSTQSDSISSELMRLDVFKDHSEFVSDLRAKRDSAIFNSLQKKGELGTDLSAGNVEIKVFKGTENYTVENIGVEVFKINFSNILNWNLTSEIKTI